MAESPARGSTILPRRAFLRRQRPLVKCVLRQFDAAAVFERPRDQCDERLLQRAPERRDRIFDRHFDQAFELNVRGMVVKVQHALKQMASGGVIVLIGSIAGNIGNPGYGT